MFLFDLFTREVCQDTGSFITVGGASSRSKRAILVLSTSVVLGTSIYYIVYYVSNDMKSLAGDSDDGVANFFSKIVHFFRRSPSGNKEDNDSNNIYVVVKAFTGNSVDGFKDDTSLQNRDASSLLVQNNVDTRNISLSATDFLAAVGAFNDENGSRAAGGRQNYFQRRRNSLSQKDIVYRNILTQNHQQQNRNILSSVFGSPMGHQSGILSSSPLSSHKKNANRGANLNANNNSNNISDRLFWGSRAVLSRDMKPNVTFPSSAAVMTVLESIHDGPFCFRIRSAQRQFKNTCNVLPCVQDETGTFIISAGQRNKRGQNSQEKSSDQRRLPLKVYKSLFRFIDSAALSRTDPDGNSPSGENMPFNINGKDESTGFRSKLKSDSNAASRSLISHVYMERLLLTTFGEASRKVCLRKRYCNKKRRSINPVKKSYYTCKRRDHRLETENKNFSASSTTSEICRCDDAAHCRSLNRVEAVGREQKTVERCPNVECAASGEGSPLNCCASDCNSCYKFTSDSDSVSLVYSSTSTSSEVSIVEYPDDVSEPSQQLSVERKGVASPREQTVEVTFPSPPSVISIHSDTLRPRSPRLMTATNEDAAKFSSRVFSTNTTTSFTYGSSSGANSVGGVLATGNLDSSNDNNNLTNNNNSNALNNNNTKRELYEVKFHNRIYSLGNSINLPNVNNNSTNIAASPAGNGPPVNFSSINSVKVNGMGNGNFNSSFNKNNSTNPNTTGSKRRKSYLLFIVSKKLKFMKKSRKNMLYYLQNNMLTEACLFCFNTFTSNTVTLFTNVGRMCASVFHHLKTVRSAFFEKKGVGKGDRRDSQTDTVSEKEKTPTDNFDEGEKSVDPLLEAKNLYDELDAILEPLRVCNLTTNINLNNYPGQNLNSDTQRHRSFQGTSSAQKGYHAYAAGKHVHYQGESGYNTGNAPSGVHSPQNNYYSTCETLGEDMNAAPFPLSIQPTVVVVRVPLGYAETEHHLQALVKSIYSEDAGCRVEGLVDIVVIEELKTSVVDPASLPKGHPRTCGLPGLTTEGDDCNLDGSRGAGKRPDLACTPLPSDSMERDGSPGSSYLGQDSDSGKKEKKDDEGKGKLKLTFEVYPAHYFYSMLYRAYLLQLKDDIQLATAHQVFAQISSDIKTTSVQLSANVDDSAKQSASSNFNYYNAGSSIHSQFFNKSRNQGASQANLSQNTYVMGTGSGHDQGFEKGGLLVTPLLTNYHFPRGKNSSNLNGNNVHSLPPLSTNFQAPGDKCVAQSVHEQPSVPGSDSLNVRSASFTVGISSNHMEQTFSMSQGKGDNVLQYVLNEDDSERKCTNQTESVAIGSLHAMESEGRSDEGQAVRNSTGSVLFDDDRQTDSSLRDAVIGSPEDEGRSDLVLKVHLLEHDDSNSLFGSPKSPFVTFSNYYSNGESLNDFGTSGGVTAEMLFANKPNSSQKSRRGHRNSGEDYNTSKLDLQSFSDKTFFIHILLRDAQKPNEAQGGKKSNIASPSERAGRGASPPPLGYQEEHAPCPLTGHVNRSRRNSNFFTTTNLTSNPKAHTSTASYTTTVVGSSAEGTGAPSVFVDPMNNDEENYFGLLAQMFFIEEPMMLERYRFSMYHQGSFSRHVIDKLEVLLDKMSVLWEEQAVERCQEYTDIIHAATTTATTPQANFHGNKSRSNNMEGINIQRQNSFSFANLFSLTTPTTKGNNNHNGNNKSFENIVFSPNQGGSQQHSPLLRPTSGSSSPRTNNNTKVFFQSLTRIMGSKASHSDDVVQHSDVTEEVGSPAHIPLSPTSHAALPNFSKTVTGFFIPDSLLRSVVRRESIRETLLRHLKEKAFRLTSIPLPDYRIYRQLPPMVPRYVMAHAWGFHLSRTFTQELIHQQRDLQRLALFLEYQQGLAEQRHQRRVQARSMREKLRKDHVSFTNRLFKNISSRLSAKGNIFSGNNASTTNSEGLNTTASTNFHNSSSNSGYEVFDYSTNIVVNDVPPSMTHQTLSSVRGPQKYHRVDTTREKEQNSTEERCGVNSDDSGNLNYTATPSAVMNELHAGNSTADSSLVATHVTVIVEDKDYPVVPDKSDMLNVPNGGSHRKEKHQNHDKDAPSSRTLRPSGRKKSNNNLFRSNSSCPLHSGIIMDNTVERMKKDINSEEDEEVEKDLFFRSPAGGVMSLKSKNMNVSKIATVDSSVDIKCPLPKEHTDAYSSASGLQNTLNEAGVMLEDGDRAHTAESATGDNVRCSPAFQWSSKQLKEFTSELHHVLRASGPQDLLSSGIAYYYAYANASACLFNAGVSPADENNKWSSLFWNGEDIANNEEEELTAGLQSGNTPPSLRAVNSGVAQVSGGTPSSATGMGSLYRQGSNRVEEVDFSLMGGIRSLPRNDNESNVSTEEKTNNSYGHQTSPHYADTPTSGLNDFYFNESPEEKVERERKQGAQQRNSQLYSLFRHLHHCYYYSITQPITRGGQQGASDPCDEVLRDYSDEIRFGGEVRKREDLDTKNGQFGLSPLEVFLCCRYSRQIASEVYLMDVAAAKGDRFVPFSRVIDEVVEHAVLYYHNYNLRDFLEELHNHFGLQYTPQTRWGRSLFAATTVATSTPVASANNSGRSTYVNPNDITSQRSPINNATKQHYLSRNLSSPTSKSNAKTGPPTPVRLPPSLAATGTFENANGTLLPQSSASREKSPLTSPYFSNSHAPVALSVEALNTALLPDSTMGWSVPTSKERKPKANFAECVDKLTKFDSEAIGQQWTEDEMVFAGAPPQLEAEDVDQSHLYEERQLLRELDHVKRFLLKHRNVLISAMLTSAGSNKLEAVFGVPATVFPFLLCDHAAVPLVHTLFQTLKAQYGKRLTVENLNHFLKDVYGHDRPEVVRHTPRVFRLLNRSRSGSISYEELCAWIARKLSCGEDKRPDKHLHATLMSLRLPMLFLSDRKFMWEKVKSTLISLSDGEDEY